MKKISALLTLLLTPLVLTGCVSIKSPGDYYRPDVIKADRTVMVSIDCSDVLDNIDKLDKGLGKYIPDYGLVIPDGNYPFREGETAYDILVRVTKQNKVQLETKGLLGAREVEGINYLYNSSCGSGSHWVCRINGSLQQSVCSEYKLQDGDVIKWIYLCS